MRRPSARARASYAPPSDTAKFRVKQLMWNRSLRHEWLRPNHL